MKTKPGGHQCRLRDDDWTVEPQVFEGSAVTECWEATDGRFWVGNGEYASAVNHCPFCGAAAPVFSLGRKS